MPLAEAAAVTRRFDDVVAVDRADLTVAPGEVVGLLGANGAGKTTLIRLLLGLLLPTTGSVRLFGTAPSRETRRRLGYVPQGLGLYEDLTPRENLAFAQHAFGVERRVLADDLRRFDDTPVGRLPLGVQRRVAFEQALAHRPDLLVLDEPTSGVGPLARARLWETIRDAADDGRGVLVTTHYMDEAQECDRLVVMADGRVVAEGSVAAIVGAARAVVVVTEQWQRAFERLERAGMAVALVGRALRVPGAHLTDVAAALSGISADIRESAASLEERFLQLSRSTQ